MKLFKNTLLMLTLMFFACSPTSVVTPRVLNDQLMSAAVNGNADAVKAHIAAGADVNASDEFGCTPLFHAADKGHTDVVRVLIAAGAASDYENFETAFMSAVYKGNTEMAKVLLAADVSIDPDTLETAYMMSLNRRNTEMVKAIKDHRNKGNHSK